MKNKNSSNFIEFPSNFLWGGGISAIQTEGTNSLKGKTIFDLHYKKFPEKFYQNIGPGKTNDFFHKYKDDLNLFKQVGANSYRTSIMWSRLFPHNGNDVDQDGVDFYKSLIDESTKNGLNLTLTLSHSDLPLWLAEEGGFTSDKYPKYFEVFANVVFENFNGLVDMFATFNEPWVPLNGGYLSGGKWPFHKQDFEGCYNGVINLLHAHAKAVNLFNTKYGGTKTKIGVVINMRPVLPRDPSNEIDVKAIRAPNIMVNTFLCDAMIKGIIKQESIDVLKDKSKGYFPNLKKDFLDELSKVKIDFVGVNYYKCQREYGEEVNGKIVSKKYNDPKARMNVFRGWEIYPKGIYDILMTLFRDYDGIPTIISENGMGVQNEHNYKDDKGIIQDDYRIAFIQEHLEWIAKAIGEGANVFGYHSWAMIDNWSIGNAYMNRYGFIGIDIDTEERHIKKSGEWFSKMTKNNGFYDDYKKIEDVIDLEKVESVKSVK